MAWALELSESLHQPRLKVQGTCTVCTCITRPRWLINAESVDTVLSRRGRFDTDPDNQCFSPHALIVSIMVNYCYHPDPCMCMYMYMYFSKARDFNTFTLYM